MAAHYALSEAVLLVAACGSAIALLRSSQFIAAIACLMLALAAGIGTWRFASGAITQLATLHQTVSQLGAVAGLGLFALCFFRLAAVADLNTPAAKLIALTVLPTLALLVIVVFSLSTFLSMLPIILALTGLLLVFLLKEKRPWQRFANTAAYGLFLANVLLIRKAPWLDAAVSWHAFHLVLALWLVLTTRLILRHIEEN